MIGAGAAQTLFEQLERAVAGAVVRFRRQEDLPAAFAECGAVVIEAAGVCGGGIAIGDALIEGAADNAAASLSWPQVRRTPSPPRPKSVT